MQQLHLLHLLRLCSLAPRYWIQMHVIHFTSQVVYTHQGGKKWASPFLFYHF